MKLVKIFGIVMAFHGAAFMFIFAIPGCRSTGKKSMETAPAAESGLEMNAPLMETEPESPLMSPQSSESSAVRFSPTRPGTPAAVEATAPVVPESISYTVVKGDSLWSIARKNGLTVRELAAANDIRADAPLKIGQQLSIPVKAPASVSAPVASVPAVKSRAPAPAKTATLTYVVKSGDTLGRIAKKYHVTVGTIATANNIPDPTKIRIGQVLRIPGGEAPVEPVVKLKPAVPAPAPAPALEQPAPAPLAPVFTSPIEPAPAPSFEEESPFITPAPESDAPILEVEESGAPVIE